MISWSREKTRSSIITLLDRVRSINLKLNKDKCKIGMTEIQYIGHIMSPDGLKPDKGKVRATVEMPMPHDRTSLLRFLGMVQYRVKFIPNLSDVSAPLRKLLEVDVLWHWDDPQQQRFQHLNNLVSHTPVLKYYDVR